MRLSVEWITEHAPVQADAEEVGRRLTMAGLELEGIEESPLGPVLNVKVTPNRGDCLSTVGVARELAAVSAVPLRAVRPPSGAGPSAIAHEPAPSVVIEAPDLCPRYAARVVRGIRAAASPPWMQSRLEAAGMRPINGVVDVTNYVMLEMGQPLHAFDFDALAEGCIVVRRARPGETIQTLDGVERALSPDMLVIADAGRAVAIAGVMGGAQTEMTDGTRTMLLESAHFNPLSIRRTARQLNLHTEASYRFERTVDPEGVVAAADRACQLIQELGLGEVVPGVVDVYPSRPPARVLGLRPERASLLLGYEVSEGEVVQSLTRLGFVCSPAGDEVLVNVPSWRPDVVREVDLAEEVGRVLGYERIPELLPAGATTQGRDTAAGRFVERVRAICVAEGLQEIESHSLLAPSPFEDPREPQCRIAIRSALSAELSGLRRSLLPGLIDAMERNARRGQAPLAFFEVGHVFHAVKGGYDERERVGAALCGPLVEPSWPADARPVPSDFYTARGIVERIASELHVARLEFTRSDDPRLHPGRAADVRAGGARLGIVGELHPALAADLTARGRIVVFELDVAQLRALAEQAGGFAPLSPQPAVVRDLAPRIGAETPYRQVCEAVDALHIDVLERYVLTDVYSGPPLPEGVRALTLSFTFRAADRTLTDAEVSDALALIRASLEARCSASFVGG